jgi:biopolymer transport protein ExbD
MRFKRSLALEHRMDMTPVVDVVFNLLIFFMLTSPFVAQAGIPIKLPEALAVTTIKPAKVEIYLLVSDVVVFEGREVTAKQLEAALAGRGRCDISATIFADQKVSIGAILQVRDICVKTGISQVNIRAMQKNSE